MHRPATSTIEHDHTPDGNGRASVLIVEDEHIARHALKYLLSCSGYKAVACESAEEALDHLDDKPPARVALIDVDLPGMSGLDLAARLEKIRPNILNVLITAAEGDRIDQFRSEHAVAYLPKPLDFQRLLDLLAAEQTHHLGN